MMRISFNRKGSLTVLAFLFMSLTLMGQSTFTESAAAYNLNVGGAKDGGHSWADYDNDGDLDALVLISSTTQRNLLMRNNGDGTFTNVQPTLAPGMIGGDRAERQAAWGDLNGDGMPDFMMNGSGGSASVVAIQIFIQNADGTFGDGIGNTAPITVGENNNATITINELNTEGTGFFDFEGDGDLDIFFDNHNFGIEILRNNYIDHVTHTIVDPPPATLFTHITPGNGAGVVEFGLNQFATDGDYGTAADVNDDGWTDIFNRKRNENDFFLNQGGTFVSGSDLGQAANNNKGANGLWDLDNDGDLDAVWTENDLTQIFRNDGPGIWTPLGGGVFPGLPQPPNTDNSTSSASIDALAGGDIDNDGDIDILLVGDSRSYLFINQLNSPTPAPGVVGSGSAMTFSLDAANFNSGRDGEGTTMLDIDLDGDLDIYMNINNGPNQLYINNLPAANRNNHIFIIPTEDRGADGDVSGVAERIAIGTNIIIKDCMGNIISGLRQANGVFGHGTQTPPIVHFGLPLGENEDYIIVVNYPNIFNTDSNSIERLTASFIAQPSTIPGRNEVGLSTAEAVLLENVNPPDAVDDEQNLGPVNTVSIQLSLFDNDSEPDGESFFIDTITQPAVGTVVVDDPLTGLVTFTYNAGTPFPGTNFTYTISDSQEIVCPALGRLDTATVNLTAFSDFDNDGIEDTTDLDDDNDGILDVVECPNINTVLWVTDGAPRASEQNTINKLIALGYTVTVVDDNAGGQNADNFAVTFIFEDANSGAALGTVANLVATQRGVVTSEVALYDDLLGANVGGANNTPLVNITNNNHPITQGLNLGNLNIGNATFHSNGITSGTQLGLHPNGQVSLAAWDVGDAIEVGVAPGRRSIVPHVDNFNAAGEDLLVQAIIWASDFDTDFDGISDHLDLDSDNDGIYDAVEAGHNQIEVNGQLSGTVGTDGIPDSVQNAGQQNSGTINYTLLDSDSDANADYIEIDSDNDGCNDVLEAGFTESTTATGTLAGTGVDAMGIIIGNTDGYTEPLDGNSNTIFDYREAGLAPLITTQPINFSGPPGCVANFTAIASNTDTYQWQVFDGTVWVNLTDTAPYSGTSTATLTILASDTQLNGTQYRVLVSSLSFLCTSQISDTVILSLSVPTVISNRRITYRVNKN